MALVGSRHLVSSCTRTLNRHSIKQFYPFVSSIISNEKDISNRHNEILYRNNRNNRNNRIDRRDFHTTCVNNNSEKENEPFVKIFNFKNPFSYISLKIKLFLLRSYFDEDFNQDEFILGAKQAISYVSTQISEGNINELDHVLTSQGVQSSRDLYFENERNPSIIKVGIEDFLNISLIDVGFEYGEEGVKHANVLIVALCMYKEGAKRKIGNIEVVTMPTKVVKYSFRREYTPGVAEESDWLVDNVEQNASTDLF